MLLGVQQLLLIDDVELYVVHVQGAQGLEDGHHLGDAEVGVQQVGLHLHVEQSALDEAAVGDVGDGFDHRRGTVDVRAAGGADALGQGHPGLTSVGQGAHLQAHGGVAGHGQDAGGHAAELAAVAFDVVGHEGEHISGDIVGVGLVVAVFGSLQAQVAHVLVALEISGQSGAHLLHCDQLLVVDQVLDGGHAVDQVGHADEEDAVAHVVLGAAPAVIQGLVDAVLESQGQGGHGTVEADLVDEVGTDHAGPHHLGDDLLDLFLKIVVGGKGVGGGQVVVNEHAALAADAVVQYQLQHAAQVDVSQGGVLMHTALQVGLHAAAGVPVPGFAKRHALVQHHADADVVVVEGGEAGAQRDALNYLAQEGVGVLGHGVADGEGGLVHLHVHSSLEDHVGQVVDRVLTVGVDAAHAQVLEHGIAGSVFRGLGVLEQAGLGELDPQAVQQLLCAVLIQAAGLHVSFIVGVDQLIEAARVVGGGVLLHQQTALIEVEGLQGFLHGLGRVFRHLVADAGDLGQLSAALRIGAFCRHLFGQFAVAVGQGDDALGGHKQGLEIIIPLEITGFGDVQFGAAGLDAGHDAGDAVLEQPAVTGSHLAEAADGFAVDVDGAVVPQGLGLVRDLGQPLLVGGAAFPVGADLVQETLAVFFVEDEGVVFTFVDGVQLVIEDAPAVVRGQQAASGLAAGRTHDQLAVVDADALFLALLAEGVGLLYYLGLARGFFEAGREYVGVLQIHLRGAGQDLIFQLTDAVHVSGHVVSSFFFQAAAEAGLFPGLFFMALL